METKEERRKRLHREAQRKYCELNPEYVKRSWEYLKKFCDTINFSTLRRLLIEALGNKCSICGVKENLELDHEHGKSYLSLKNIKVLCSKCNKNKRHLKSQR